MSDIPATPPADDSLPALPPEYSACRGSGKARVHQVLIGVYLVLIGKAVVFTWMLFWLILSRVFETSGGLVDVLKVLPVALPAVLLLTIAGVLMVLCTSPDKPANGGDLTTGSLL